MDKVVQLEQIYAYTTVKVALLIFNSWKLRTEYLFYPEPRSSCFRILDLLLWGRETNKIKEVAHAL